MSDWDARYDTPEYIFGEAPNGFLASQIEHVKRHKRALAVADGEGRNGVWLAEQGLAVTSMDASGVAQDKARKLAARRGVSLDIVKADVTTYAWPEAAYDLVVGIFIQFVGPEARAKMFDGMVRALAPGGTLILLGYGPRQLEYRTGGPGQLENLYTEELLSDHFGALDIVHLHSHDSVMNESPRHTGMSALVEMVARKTD